jgi:hypothetical protein
MPWIISDYDSYNLTPKLRDLSKPMGCITDARDEIFETNYEESNEYFYPCHYSYGAAVHFFLYRTPPFTYFEWDLHQGWDNPNRVFHSFSSTWKSASEIGRNDVKELIPEAFFVPELFQNINSFNFTNVENNIVDVTIPPFCFSMQHFILSNRAALNASEDIDKWIDLIFGVNQTGQGAIQNKNLFPKITYHNYDLKRLNFNCSMLVNVHHRSGRRNTHKDKRFCNQKHH